MQTSTIEISIGGRWFAVPSIRHKDLTIAVTGRWLKLAVIQHEDYIATELKDPEQCIAMLKQWGPRIDVLTFSQKLPGMVPRFSYPMDWESVAAVRTTRFQEWWDSLPQESRKNVRRAQKRGVEVVVKQIDDDLVRDIVSLNNDSPLRQGRRFVHYGKTFDQVKKDQAEFPGRSDYVCAYYQRELIGFMKLVYRGDVAAIVQILPRASQADKRPANALLAKAVELCAAKGVAHLTYGLFNYGNRHDSSLRQFKIRNGFQEILKPRYYVPLTIWGRICVRLRLYRGLIGLAPERVIRLAAWARAKVVRHTALIRRPV